MQINKQPEVYVRSSISGSGSVNSAAKKFKETLKETLIEQGKKAARPPEGSEGSEGSQGSEGGEESKSVRCAAYAGPQSLPLNLKKNFLII